jgi:16S rRNA (guanine527-N7)-methyltransferase
MLQGGASYVLGRELTRQEAGQFNKYLELLVKWDRVFALIGSGDPAWIVRNLLLDSLLFLRVLPPGATRILDFGSGAGVPGIPMKIARSELQLTLIEARRRRASFLATAIRELEFQGVSTINERVEAVASELAGKFDAVVARCAGDPLGVLSIGLNLVRREGVVLISGPPEPYPVPLGEWITVPGTRLGETRAFLTAQRP